MVNLSRYIILFELITEVHELVYELVYCGLKLDS